MAQSRLKALLKRKPPSSVSSGTIRQLVILSPTFLPIYGGAEVGIHELASRISIAVPVTVLAPRQLLREASSTELATFRKSKSAYRLKFYWNPFLNLPRGKIRSVLVALCIPEIIALLGAKAFYPSSLLNVHFARPFGLILCLTRIAPQARGMLSLVGRSDVLADISRIARLQLRLAARAADFVTVNSPYYLADDVLANRAVCIPYGQSLSASANTFPDEIRARLSVRTEDVVMLAVQRLSFVKRVDVLIQVASALSLVRTPRGGNYHLFIVGAGEDEGRLQDLARLDAAHNVHFCGYLDQRNVEQLMSVADVFTSHSTSETFGVTFVEAMAAGLPIVTISATSIPLVVKDGVNGLLVDPFDVSAFADAVQRVSQSALGAALSGNNRRIAQEEYDWNVVAEKYISLIREGVGR